MDKLAAIFTPERRQKIQLFFGSLAPLLILTGFATEEETQQYLIITGALLQFFASILSLINVRKGDYGAVWAIVRGAIYTLAAIVSPVLVFFGLYDETTNTALLTGLSLGLSSLSSLLAIFIGKSQQLHAVEKAAALVISKSPVSGPYNGALVVNMTDPEKETYQLQIDQPWDELAKLPEVRIQVVDQSTPVEDLPEGFGNTGANK